AVEKHTEKATYLSAATRLQRSPRLHGALEVDADPRLEGRRALGHTMDPIRLTPAAHDDEVARMRCERDRRAAAARFQPKSARCAERQDGDDAAWPTAGKTIAMPPRAVAAVSIEIQPHAVVHDAVVVRQRRGHLHDDWVRH